MSLHYQSPISISLCHSIEISQKLKVCGKNREAIYDPTSKIFQVTDNIILKTNHKKYKLNEYHFHIPSEHEINGHLYPAEIHYVFTNIKTGDLLVIARLIKSGKYKKDLDKIQVKLPSCFFEYDGGLTTGDTSTPVRWIVGGHPLKFNLEQLEPVAKTNREIQPLEGRLILYSPC